MDIIYILEYQYHQFKIVSRFRIIFLIMIAGFTILISAIMVSVISRKFTEPILELNKIAQNMANLVLAINIILVMLMMK